MKARDVQTLRQLAALDYQARQRAVFKLQEQEFRLRAAIAATEAARRDADATPDADLARQRIGADVAWQALQDRRRRDLMIELARTLAQREPLMAALRRSFGRESVLSDLAGQAQAEARQIRARKTDAES